MTYIELPLISIVVPIYKVQDYICQCLDSITNQSYENLEIILVDDGSPDECGKIIDDYSKRDSRIICIHKTNGGAASARNAGKAIAKGDYIAFIDSDDYLNRRFIEILYRDLIDSEADISICSFDSFVCESIERNISSEGEVKAFTGLEAIHEMFKSDSIGWNPWNKLYKSELFKDIDYPEGNICEDKATIYKVYYKANKVVYREFPLYHYRVRGTSTSGQRSVKYYSDSMLINEQMEKDFEAAGIRILVDLVKSYIAKNGFLDYSETFDRSGYEEIAEISRQKLICNYRYLKYADYIQPLQRVAIYIGGLSARYGRNLILKLLSLIARMAVNNRIKKLT